jgi:hypothetical protein
MKAHIVALDADSGLVHSLHNDGANESVANTLALLALSFGQTRNACFT